MSYHICLPNCTCKIGSIEYSVSNSTEGFTCSHCNIHINSIPNVAKEPIKLAGMSDIDKRWIPLEEHEFIINYWKKDEQLNLEIIHKLKNEISELEDKLYHTAKEIAEIKYLTDEKIRILIEALLIIEDITYAFSDKRNTSYSDWELRKIAKLALEKVRGIK